MESTCTEERETELTASLIDRLPICILRYVFEFLKPRHALMSWGLCKQWRTDAQRNGEEQLLWAALLSRDATEPMRRLLDELRKGPEEPSCFPQTLLRRAIDSTSGILDIRRLYYVVLFNTVVCDITRMTLHGCDRHRRTRTCAPKLLLASHNYGFTTPLDFPLPEGQRSLQACCDPFLDVEAEDIAGISVQPLAHGAPSIPALTNVAGCLSNAIMTLNLQEIDMTGWVAALRTSGSRIPGVFLDSCSSLTVADFGGTATFPVSLGYRFLASCTRLTSIDISGFRGVAFIPHGFLSYCSSLIHVDVSSLANVVEMGNFVLRACSSLTSINLDGMESLAVVGEGFLLGCYRLTSFSISGPQRLRRVGPRFLCQCVQLTTVNLESLSCIDTVPDDFMRSCESLVSATCFSCMTHVKRVGSGFLENCHRLNELCPFDPRVEIFEVGDGFLASCPSLTSVDLSSMHATRLVGKYFLSQCESLTLVDFSCLRSLQRISVGFLSGCRSLTSVSLCNSTNLEFICQRFLANCTSLTSVDLSGLSNLNSVGSNFLIGCVRLVELKLIGLRSLNTIRLELRNRFLHGVSSKLERVVIDDTASHALRTAVSHLGHVVVVVDPGTAEGSCVTSRRR